MPFPLAVRVVNLSQGGAMIEIHDRTRIEMDIMLPNRFFELKVAHPEIPLLRGTVAWSDTSRQNPTLGLACFERSAQLSKIVEMTESLPANGPPPLPTPVIDPVPPVVEEEWILLTGMAKEAMEVIVKRDEKKYVAKVHKERFEVRVELEQDAENQFSLRSQAGERKSRAIPVQVNCESARSNRFSFDARMGSEKTGRHTLTIEFNSNVRQAERILYRLSQLMAASERVDVTATLESSSEFDKRLFESLRSEAAVLAADTSKNEAASRLLDELL